MFINILILTGTLVIMIIGGDLLVRGASEIAIKAKISPLIVGLTIVAFGTSAPELVISVTSALSGSSDIALGNVVGANICNLALILGFTAILHPVDVKRSSLLFDWPVTMGSGVLLYIMVREGMLTPMEGLFFIALLVSYLSLIIYRYTNDKILTFDLNEELDLKVKKGTSLKNISFILIGCVGLYFGSKWFVGSAQVFARLAGVEERIIGLTVVAVGTSLPELVTSIVAAFKKETDIAIGNLMGSNIFNILGILGITSIFKNVSISDVIINKDLIWMLGITIGILPMMLYNRRISRIDGIILLMVYIYYTYSLVW